LVAIPAMVPFIVLAERRDQVRSVLIGSVAVLGLSTLGFYLFNRSLWLIGVLLAVVFTIFNLLEAVLPALVSKAAPAGTKGTAMGVFSSAQFIGAFLGGLLGGLAHAHFGVEAVYLVGGLTSLLWLRLVWTLPIPEDLSRHVIALDTSGAGFDVSSLEQQLLEVPGVKEAVIAVDEGVAYLKVDSRHTDWTRLQRFSAVNV